MRQAGWTLLDHDKAVLTPVNVGMDCEVWLLWWFGRICGVDKTYFRVVFDNMRFEVDSGSV